MKAKIFFLSLILFFCVQSRAQVSFGVTGGLNISRLTESLFGESVSNPDLGYFLGGTAEYKRGNFLADVSLLFVNKKGRWEYYRQYNGFDGSLTDNVNYLSLPVAIGYRTPFEEKMNLILRTGPSLHYRLNSYEKFRIYDDSMVEREDCVRTYKKFPLGWEITCGLETGKVSLSIGYDLGLTPAVSLTRNLEKKIYIRTFLIRFGYLF